MVLIIAILLMGALWAVNSIVSKSTALPSTVFCAAWTLNLGGLFLAGESLYPISDTTVAIYVAGAVSLTLGSMFVFLLADKQELQVRAIDPAIVQRSRILLDIGLLICILGIPAYAAIVLQRAEGATLQNFLFLVRHRTLNTTERNLLDPVENLPVLAMLVAYAMNLETDGTKARRVRALFATVLAILYGSALGAKGNSVLIVVTTVFLHLIREKRANLRKLLPGIMAGVALFVVGLIVVNMATVRVDSTPETFSLIADNFKSYWLGGMVAFDQVVRFPGTVANSQGFERFFVDTANAFGGNFYLPNFHAMPISISNNGIVTNIYTMYFSYYPSVGWFGVLLFPALVGAFATWSYVAARRGGKTATLLYAVTTGGLLFTFNGEHFFLALNFYCKLLIFTFLVYGLPELLQRVERSRSRSAAAVNGVAVTR